MRLFFSTKSAPSGFVMVISGVSVLRYQRVTLSSFKVLGGHLLHQGPEVGARRPAQFLACLGGVSEQSFDFGRAEVTRIDRDDRITVLVKRLLAQAASLPLQVDVHTSCRHGDK